MSWISNYSGNVNNPNYTWDVVSGKFIRDSINPTQSSLLSNYTPIPYKFKSNKTYIWKTVVKNFNDLETTSGHPIRKLSISPPYKLSATFSWCVNTYTSLTTSPGFPPVITLNIVNFENGYTLPKHNDDNNTLIFIDSPVSDISSDYKVRYSATNKGFGATMTSTPGIISSSLIEVDWLIQGYSFATSSSPGYDSSYEGWRFDENNESFTFVHSTNTSNERRHPICIANNILSGDMNPTARSENAHGIHGVTSSNFICKYVGSQNFNLSLKVDIDTGSWVDVYLFNTQPPITKSATTFQSFLTTGQKIGRLGSGDLEVDFYNLTGNSYLTFISEYKNTNNNYKNTISEIKIVEGYSTTDNNESFLLTESDLYLEPTQLLPIGTSDNSTYSVTTITNQTIHDSGTSIFGAYGSTGSFGGYFSTQLGTIKNLKEIKSKIGNGTFKAGIWENGVWNSGLRIDENIHQFDDVKLSIKMTTENIKWRIEISGSTFSTSHFDIGDKISISNIVSIDINEQRKLLKNYFTIINKSETSIIVETSNNFPIRRIEKDSPNHKILVTKNVWLNGGFLNGYFKGIWNDGLFRGYPYITEMENSHWLDGTFNGGHFKSTKYSYEFVDTYFWNGSVGLTFGATQHGFLPGDVISIDKFDKTVNPTYDGEYKITEIVDDYLAITNIPWGGDTPTGTEGGIVYNQSNTGLVQKFKFFDNNVATKNSKTSNTPKEIWKFNSWMDLVFKTQSSTNIGSNKILYNDNSNNISEILETHKFGMGDYTALNLYGYTTHDVLSSESQFKDIDSSTRRFYSLGTKYEIYQDFLGDISSFNNPFDTDSDNLENFYADGWTYSFSGIRATHSYLNKYIKERNPSLAFTSYQKLTIGSSMDSSIPAGIGDNSSAKWYPISFNILNEDDYNGLLTESSPNSEWEIGSSGEYDIKINLNTSFETSVLAPGIGGLLDNDYIYITSDVLVGQIRLIKWDYQTNSQVILVNKTIKTSGGNYNIGTSTFEEGAYNPSFSKQLFLNIDWKGELKQGDKIRVEIQTCSTKISSYNTAGPWRGSGFDTDLGVVSGVLFNPSIYGLSTNDHFTEIFAQWTINQTSRLFIFNSGVNTSLGFKMKRTSNKTLQYQSDNEISFFTLNNSNINIEKNRYSMIEFDIIQQPDSLIDVSGYGTQSGFDSNFSMQFQTIDLYNFTNFISDEFIYGPTHSFPSGYDPIVDSPYPSLNIYSNGIDYKYLGKTTVTEYFYNRPGLDLGLWNFNSTDDSSTKTHEIDNVKFYEVDMIPFFKYTTEDYINKQIQVPFIGTAPVIDYTDEGFSFISGIQIGLDGITIDSTGLINTTGSNTIFVTPGESLSSPTLDA